MENIVASYNIFVDSSRGRINGNKGDDYKVSLVDSGIHANAGEFIRLNLENFSMAKNFYDIHRNNSQMTVRAKHNGAGPDLVHTTSSTGFNCLSVADVAEHFEELVAFALIDLVNQHTPGTAAAYNSVFRQPQQTDTIGKRMIVSDIQLLGGPNAATVINHELTDIRIQFYSELSDSYALFGGDRIADRTDVTSSSMDVTLQGTNTIQIRGRYTAQRTTNFYVYIRAPNLLNANIESHGFDTRDETVTSETMHSDILGRAPIHEESVQYTASTGREFFIDIHQKNLTHLQLKLTDQHKSALPLVDSGGAHKQNTRGNMEFTAVIRVDIIKKRQVKELETTPYEPNLPARFSNGVVLQQRNGKDMFSVGPGFQ